MLGNNNWCQPLLERPERPDLFIIANDLGDMGATNYSLANGVLNINNGTSPTLKKKNFDIPWPLIDREDGVKVLCPQEPVAQVDTVTTVTLPDANCCGDLMWYYITISWHDFTDGSEQSHTYPVSFTTGTTYTATQISTDVIAAINADPNAIVTAAAVGATFTLTAKNPGQPFLTKTNIALQTVAHSTANKISFGDGDDLIKWYGFTAADGIDGTNEYIIVEIPYFTVREGDIPSDNTYSGQRVLSKHTLWLVVESGGTAEDAVLGTTNATGLCKILTGQDTASKYLAVMGLGCPCS